MTDDLWARFATTGWDDLALNRPGEAVRRKADELHAQWRAKPLLTRLFTPRTAERSWRRGAEGEELVARRLAPLGASWHVLHAVPVGDRDADIDHLVIGPTGVFTINAKNHQGKRIWVSGDILMVNGFRQPHVRNARYEAQRASRLISGCVGFEVPVRGLVVLVGTASETVKEQPRDGAVLVATPRAARRWIQRQPEVLSEAAVERVYAMARRSTTWTSAVRAG